MARSFKRTLARMKALPLIQAQMGQIVDRVRTKDKRYAKASSMTSSISWLKASRKRTNQTLLLTSFYAKIATRVRYLSKEIDLALTATTMLDSTVLISLFKTF